MAGIPQFLATVLVTFGLVAGLLAPGGSSASEAKLEPTKESCGWAVEQGDTLDLRPDPRLKPLDNKAPFPDPPAGTKAVYCDRDSIITAVSDVRVLTDLRMPLIIRDGDRVGVIDYAPSIVLHYEMDDQNRWIRRIGPPAKCEDPRVICARDPGDPDS